MYLKQLELVGFKSFAERTVLDFERGITAIVGPNGCGKSNISDAIRWVLGEQSAKLLRGSNMQDVIFSGTDERKPVGFAQVALTLADTDSILPIEYSEVTIARRVYRTGESEYYLNKTLCRLKDIRELFMGTGVGSNPYSMIEQGNIDQLISSKPEERRFVFEEAAGITKFKEHKKEALRKLDATEANLVRVQDIIREVKKQINSINRQASKARSYQAHVEELKAAEVKSYAHKFQELSQAIVGLDQESRNLQFRRDESEKALSLLEGEMSRLRLNLESVSQALANKNTQRQVLESEVERIEHQVQDHTSRRETSQRKVAQWTQEIHGIEEKLSEIERSLGSEDGEESRLAEESAAISRQVAQEEAALGELLSFIDEVQKKLLEQKSQIVGAASQESQAKNSLVHLQAEEKTLQQEKQRLLQEMEENAAAEKQQALDLQKLGELLQNEEARLGQIGRMLEEKLEKVSRIRYELEALDKEHSRKNASFSEKKSTLELLIDLKNRFEGFFTGVKSILQAAQGGGSGLTGICGVVADLVQVPREYEIAIEVALGGRIQNIVTETGEDAKGAIEFLKRHHAGQATFLPLDLLKPGQIYQLPEKWSNPGVIGNACDFVKYDPKYYNVFKTLLGNTIIVRDMESALAVARHREVSCQLVTLDGDAITSRGAITGGSSQNKVRGFISRDGQIEELKRDLLVLEKIMRDSEERRNVLIQERDAAEKETQEIQTTLHHQRVTVATQKNEKAKVEAAVLQAGQNRSLFETELKRVEEQIAANLERQQELGREVDSTVHLNLNLQSGLASAEKELLEKISEKDQRTQELNGLKITQAQVQEKEKGFAGRRAQMEETRASQLRLRDQYRDQIAEAVQQGEASAAALLRLDGELKELEKNRGGFSSQYEELAKQREAAASEIQAKEEEVRQCRQRLNELQTQVHNVEIKLTQDKLRRENLVTKVEEDYQVSIETIQIDPQETIDWAALEQKVAALRQKIDAMGPVNLVAIEELKELEERHAFLEKQHQDLVEAKAQLIQAINKINTTTREMFQATFEQIRANFKETFAQLFNGGRADIILLDDNPDVLEAGIDIIARPPGKKLTSVSLMSGGERALTAVALLFAIFKVKPSPFCVLDEIDAPLDEANINRFVEMVQGFALQSQFVVITHNKRTIAASDAMYGITMEESGISKVVSVRLKGWEEEKALPGASRGAFGFAGK